MKKKVLIGGLAMMSLFTLASCEGGNNKPKELTETTVYVVGDSTVCDYGKYDSEGNKTGITDTTYFYDRYGYATQFYNFFDEKVTVKNLALSGRSSKSFLKEDNYKTLESSIKEGDYLVVGFGHNDEKGDDAERFSSAKDSTTTEGSFKNVLYENYVKLAESKGASTILCSPITRLDKTNAYTGTVVHDTTYGNYATAVKELGEEKNVPVVDLTTLTSTLYASVGYESAISYHAISAGLDDNTPNTSTVDATHINIYGAKTVAYLFANELKNTSSTLKDYVKADLVAPTKEADLIKNPNFVYTAYTSVNWEAYAPADNLKTITDGWYGTGFGDTGGAPDSATNGYFATETSKGVFKVGQKASSNKGKFATSGDGFAFCFKDVSSSVNFTLTAKAKVLTSAETKQAGFGLMLRDDCYTPTKDASCGQANYVCAGLLSNDSEPHTTLGFKRESNKIVHSENKVNDFYKADDTAEFKIERVGQVITCTVTYKGSTTTETYTDFDLFAVDSNKMYVGMFANRGTTVEFTNVVYTVTGTSLGA